MQCQHNDYDDYFEKCNDCDKTSEQIHIQECMPNGFLDEEIGDEYFCGNCGVNLNKIQKVLKKTDMGYFADQV